MITSSRHLAFPLRLDHHGRLATADDQAHLVQMIEQLLFTAPGERVNRPDFGVGVIELLFEPANPALVRGLDHLLHAQLTRELGSLLRIDEITVQANGGVLQVEVAWTALSTGAATRTVYRRDPRMLP